MADIRSLDIEPLATIKLSTGEHMDIPRLTTSKLIKVAKFLAIDGMKIYENYRDTIEDPELGDAEKVATIVQNLSDEQIIRLLAILLNIRDEEALQIDPFDTLEIITTYVENIDLDRTKDNVKKLMNQFRKKQNQNTQAVSSPVGSS